MEEAAGGTAPVPKWNGVPWFRTLRTEWARPQSSPPSRVRWLRSGLATPDKAGPVSSPGSRDSHRKPCGKIPRHSAPDLPSSENDLQLASDEADRAGPRPDTVSDRLQALLSVHAGAKSRLGKGRIEGGQLWARNTGVEPARVPTQGLAPPILRELYGRTQRSVLQADRSTQELLSSPPRIIPTNRTG